MPSFGSSTPLGCYFTQVVNQYPIMLCSTGHTGFPGSKDSGSRIKLDSWQDRKVLHLGWVIRMRVQSCQALAYFIYKTPLSTVLYVWQNSIFSRTLSELLSLSEWRQLITPPCAGTVWKVGGTGLQPQRELWSLKQDPISTAGKGSDSVKVFLLRQDAFLQLASKTWLILIKAYSQYDITAS